MLADEHDALTQSEVLVGPIRNGSIEGCLRYRDCSGGCDHPPNVQCMPIPQLHLEAHVGDVVQVRVRQLPKQCVHAVIKVRGGAIEVAALGAQWFEQAERVELALLVGWDLTHSIFDCGRRGLRLTKSASFIVSLLLLTLLPSGG